MTADLRYIEMSQWLTRELPGLFAEQGWGEVPQWHLEPASSDMSHRRYFRWQGAGRSLVVMDAPVDLQDCRPFVAIARRLRDATLNVPQVYRENFAEGFLLLSDLGLTIYLDALDPQRAPELFAPAVDALLTFQTLSTDGLPVFDEAFLRRELALFPEWYVERHLGSRLEGDAAQIWQSTCDLLVANALEQPRVFMHRDYMPRNLMVCEPLPGILDFQDAVAGPVTYDITSLYKDAFLSWPEDDVQRWLAQYWQQARQAGIPVHSSLDAFLHASDLMGVQRHLKIFGLFARFYYRNGRDRYLADLPRFHAYIQAVAQRRAELRPFAALLQQLREREPALA